MKQTPFELTEEIKCFTDLRKDLSTRIRRASREINDPELNVKQLQTRADRAHNLSKQLKIVEHHLLQCFQLREEQS